YAIFLLDPAGRIVTWNAGAERIKGWRAEEIVGQHFSRFYPEDALERRWPEQELALAAARELATARDARGAMLLAAGTDGRDGDTDAAGAMVDAGTWGAIARAGRDPERDLATHDSHPALDAAGALLRTDLTGTNVMDVVIGVCALPVPPASGEGPFAELAR
ncbi:MAG TPA: MOFRL family protein, partial [Gemmatimonadaceae bacterium]|nr:MOFRL family protein [Gemmatimonadaceae bacterium]